MGGGIYAECNYNNSIYTMMVTDDYVIVAGSFSHLGGFGNVSSVVHNTHFYIIFTVLSKYCIMV
jgi:hypothetical protein